MSNANEPAYPEMKTELEYNYSADQNYPNTYSVGGLTKREYAAIAAMHGLLRDRYADDVSKLYIAKVSVEFADALLAELERTTC